MTLTDLALLQQQLIDAKTLSARNDILTQMPSVRRLLQIPNGFSRFHQRAPLEIQYVLKQLAAIGQGFDVDQESLERWQGLVKTSIDIDRFYRETYAYKRNYMGLDRNIKESQYNDQVRYRSYE